MKKTITINGKTYKTKELDFNFICGLEDMGISLGDNVKDMKFIRSFMSILMGKSPSEAGNEINQHIINGGSFDDITEIINEAVNESGFFQALNQGKKSTQSKSKAEA